MKIAYLIITVFGCFSMLVFFSEIAYYCACFPIWASILFGAGVTAVCFGIAYILKKLLHTEDK